MLERVKPAVDGRCESPSAVSLSMPEGVSWV
ncbi:hypothetical protein F4557_005650 [Actinomadura catellatispora]|uniref:Uncharacterized protein n=1 Tax=Actinomadura livida TaxID=79909 RepID=A0A7W7N0T3_9ACTN|nr:hypothetical protein [Actinomadura catellatispora]